VTAFIFPKSFDFQDTKFYFPVHAFRNCVTKHTHAHTQTCDSVKHRLTQKNSHTEMHTHSLFLGFYRWALITSTLPSLFWGRGGSTGVWTQDLLILAGWVLYHSSHSIPYATLSVDNKWQDLILECSVMRVAEPHSVQQFPQCQWTPVIVSECQFVLQLLSTMQDRPDHSGFLNTRLILSFLFPFLTVLHYGMIPHFIFFTVRGLNSELCACKAGALPLEPHPNPSVYSW
jgi:hypothetical protein